MLTRPFGRRQRSANTLETMTLQRELRKTQRILELPPTIQHGSIRPRMKPRRRFAFETGEQFRHANFSALALAHWIGPIAHVAIVAAAIAGRPPIKQP
jgi:hypothetical protein